MMASYRLQSSLAAQSWLRQHFRTRPTSSVASNRTFCATARRNEIVDIATLPPRIIPKYEDSATSSLLSLHWPEPPRNILLIPKLHAPQVVRSAVAFAKHLHDNYPSLNIIFESRIAQLVHENFDFPVYSTTTVENEAGETKANQIPEKVDLVTTLGGDGTILRAASLFSLNASVPPILSFSMGSLGFLGEWKFEEYKRAWREVYMSGSGVSVHDLVDEVKPGLAGRSKRKVRDEHDGFEPESQRISWGSSKTRDADVERTSKILLRHRIKVGVYDSHGVNINGQLMPTATGDTLHRLHADEGHQAQDKMGPPRFHAINELLIHRGPHPHLAIIDIYLNNHFLTEAVADGILISTPTGSTAYSLSAGGSIIHPLVGSLLITPICARSLSFRPLVLPLNTKVVLRLSERNRGRELEVSIDGKRRAGVTIGMEVRVEGEMLTRAAGTDQGWTGGVPCVIRAPGKGENDAAEDDDGWVGGLNGLLKFNYPFGEGGQ
jgi:NADH kinase